jgi:hypothetical protein
MECPLPHTLDDAHPSQWSVQGGGMSEFWGHSGMLLSPGMRDVGLFKGRGLSLGMDRCGVASEWPPSTSVTALPSLSPVLLPLLVTPSSSLDAFIKRAHASP